MEHRTFVQRTQVPWWWMHSIDAPLDGSFEGIFSKDEGVNMGLATRGLQEAVQQPVGGVGGRKAGWLLQQALVQPLLKESVSKEKCVLPPRCQAL